MSDETSTQVNAEIEGTRIRGYAVHGGYFDVPLFTQITNRQSFEERGELWVGGTPAENPKCLVFTEEVGSIQTTRSCFDRILCLYPWEPYDVLAPCEKVEVELYDSLNQPLDKQILELAGRVRNWLDEDLTVLVHCQAGLNRSNLVAALALRMQTGMSGDEVITVLREARSPEVLCNEKFAQFVREWLDCEEDDDE